jgi:hypothetical protein
VAVIPVKRERESGKGKAKQGKANDITDLPSSCPREQRPFAVQLQLHYCGNSTRPSSKYLNLNRPALLLPFCCYLGYSTADAITHFETHWYGANTHCRTHSPSYFDPPHNHSSAALLAYAQAASCKRGHSLGAVVLVLSSSQLLRYSTALYVVVLR